MLRGAAVAAGCRQPTCDALRQDKLRIEMTLCRFAASRRLKSQSGQCDLQKRWPEKVLRNLDLAGQKVLV